MTDRPIPREPLDQRPHRAVCALLASAALLVVMAGCTMPGGAGQYGSGGEPETTPTATEGAEHDATPRAETPGASTATPAPSPDQPAAPPGTPGPSPGEPATTPSPTATATPTETADADPDSAAEPFALGAVTLAPGMEDPCALAVAPDGGVFIAEHRGRIHYLDGEDGDATAVHGLRVIDEPGAGLRGIALDPDYPEQPYLYAMYTSEPDDDGARNRIARLVVDGDDFETDRILVDDLPAGEEHNGGAIAFGPDDLLYATLGDLGDPDTAVDQGSPRGTILRLDRDGAVPPDNPEPDSYVYSSGHRDPVALAWDSAGTLFVIDADESGGSRIDRVEAGSDYGWPEREDDASAHPEPVAMLPGAAIAGAAAPAPVDAAGGWAAHVLVAGDQGPVLYLFDPDAPHAAPAAVSVQAYADRLCGLTPGIDGDLYAGALRPGERRGDRVVRIAPFDALDLRYPDLRTKAPTNIGFDHAWVEGEQRPVLRFTNTVANLGEGPLEIVAGEDDYSIQRIYSGRGGYLERASGELIYHWSHAHFHFDHFNRFELWDRESYEEMLDGDADAAPRWKEDKVSMCLMDLIPLAEDLEATPDDGAYATACAETVQGISVGWGDIYYFDIPEQWVVVDGDFDDGEYVLRSIVDSENVFHESPGGRSEPRESHEANGAATWFTLQGGEVHVTHTESGAERFD